MLRSLKYMSIALHYTILFFTVYIIFIVSSKKNSFTRVIHLYLLLQSLYCLSIVYRVKCKSPIMTNEALCDQPSTFLPALAFRSVLNYFDSSIHSTVCALFLFTCSFFLQCSSPACIPGKQFFQTSSGLMFSKTFSYHLSPTP